MNLCTIIGHKRNAEQARTDDVNGWRSFCTYCGSSMVRDRPGVWRLREQGEQVLSSLTD